MEIAVVGATGLVGRTMLDELETSSLPIKKLIPVASSRSVGQTVLFRGQPVPVVDIEKAIALRPRIALFSAGGDVSRAYAPRFAQVGTVVIDNSSAWRMDTAVPLVVPSVNGAAIKKGDRIIANPNCSTIQLVMAVAPLHRAYGIRRLVVSTYQAVSGSGQRGVKQLMDERAGNCSELFYPHPILDNVLPHIDVFMDNGYTKEEMKIVGETRKILDDNNLAVTATAARVPVVAGHSESVNVTFERDFSLADVRSLLSSAPAVQIRDNSYNNDYPLAAQAAGQKKVFVGRLRRDDSFPNSLNMWVVADNLRIGAATNAVWIAEYMANSRVL